MKEAQIISEQPRLHHYKHATGINREFDVDAPNEVWRGDMTYVCAGQRYAILYLFSRRVVGWAISENPDEALTTKALKISYEQRRCDVSFRPRFSI